MAPISLLVTERRSVAKNVGCFRRDLFVCGFVDSFVKTITSEQVNTGWWNLKDGCSVQKSRLSSNLGVIALWNFLWITIMCHIATYLTIQSHSPGGVTFPACWHSRQWLAHCNVWRAAGPLRRWENQRRLSSFSFVNNFFLIFISSRECWCRRKMQTAMRERQSRSQTRSRRLLLGKKRSREGLSKRYWNCACCDVNCRLHTVSALLSLP